MIIRSFMLLFIYIIEILFIYLENYLYKINKIENRIYLHDFIFCFLFNEMNSLNQKTWLKNIP